MSEEITYHLESIKKGKASIAEALKELDLAKSSFNRLESVEKAQARQEFEIQKMSAYMSNLLQSHIFNQKIEDLVVYIDRAISSKLEDSLKLINHDLKSKISHENLGDILKSKVNYRNFNSLTQDFNDLKARLDRHLLSDFEGLRTKMKIEISQRVNEAKDLFNSFINSEEINSIRSRLNSVEMQLNEIIAEQNQLLEEDEDYDSEEEMDNINDSLVKVNSTNRYKEETEINDDRLPNDSKVASQDTQDAFNTRQKEETHPNNPTDNSGNPLHALPGQVSPDITHKNQTNEFFEDSKFLMNSQKSLPAEASFEKKSSLKNSLEIPVKKAQEVTILEDLNDLKKYSKRQSNEEELKRNESAPKIGYSRLASSRASSKSKSGLFGSAVLNNFNKKISALRREIESFKAETSKIFNMISTSEKDIEDNQNSIFKMKDDIKSIHETSAKMEQSFIRALNRRGIELKNEKKKPYQPVIFTDTDKFNKKIKEKLQRIVALETSMDKVINDTNHMKLLQKEKLNEIIQTIHHLNDARNKVDKEFTHMQKYVIKLEENLKSEVETIQKKVEHIENPLTSILSDQQRENQQLTEDMRRHQGLLRNIIEDYIGTLDYHRSIYSNLPEERSIESAHRVYSSVHNSKRIQTASPAVSLKQRFASQDASRLNENSVDGKVLSLPRMTPRITRRQQKLSVKQF